MERRTFSHPEGTPAFAYAAHLDAAVLEPLLWVLLRLSAERRVAEGDTFTKLWATVRAIDWAGAWV